MLSDWKAQHTATSQVFTIFEKCKTTDHVPPRERLWEVYKLIAHPNLSEHRVMQYASTTATKCPCSVYSEQLWPLPKNTPPTSLGASLGMRQPLPKYTPPASLEASLGMRRCFVPCHGNLGRRILEAYGAFLHVGVTCGNRNAAE